MRGVVAAAFAVVVMAGAALAQEECRLTLAVSLPMSPEHINRVIVPAMIDGKPLQLMIDTGSGVSGITAEAAARLGIEPHLITGELKGRFPYGGGRVTHFVRAERFTLGGMTAPDVQLMLLPGKFAEADGLMGADFLRQFDVEFDFAASKVNLFRPHPCPGKVVYWTSSAPVAVIPFRNEQYDRNIRIEYTLDGQRVPAIVDTGAPNTSISLTTAKMWFHIDENSPGIWDRRDGAFRYRFKSMSLDGITVQNPELLIHEKAEGGDTLDFQSLLGMNILRQLHLYVAYKEHKLYVTSASAR